jgi:hypothetical protein
MIIYVTQITNIKSLDIMKEAWINKLKELNIPYIIVCADNTLPNSYVFNPNNNVLIVKAPADYEYHTLKLIYALQFILERGDEYKDIKGIVKIEDDVLVNVNKLVEYLSDTTEKKDYEGWKYKLQTPIGVAKHRPKVKNEYLKNLIIVLEPSIYCLGSMYWLSKNAIDILVKFFKTKPFCIYSWHIFEDYAVAKILKLAGIEPTDTNMFTENLTYFMQDQKHIAFHDKFQRYELLPISKKINL